MRIPKPIRFVIINSAIGVLIGWAVAGAVIWLDVLAFDDLVMRSSQRGTVLFVLGLAFGATFAFGYLTTATLLLPWDKERFDKM